MRDCSLFREILQNINGSCFVGNRRVFLGGTWLCACLSNSLLDFCREGPAWGIDWALFWEPEDWIQVSYLSLLYVWPSSALLLWDLQRLTELQKFETLCGACKENRVTWLKEKLCVHRTKDASPYWIIESAVNLPGFESFLFVLGCVWPCIIKKLSCLSFFFFFYLLIDFILFFFNFILFLNFT